jgi:Ca2+-binding RTX toxin-like protein
LAGNDIMDGDEGNDILFGGLGHDTMEGGFGADRLYGEAGNDIMDGDAGNDLLNGGAGNDFVFGGEGADVMIGSTGNDVLDGDTGNDRMAGGLGNDRFDFDSGDGDDIVTDFTAGGTLDRLDLRNAAFDFRTLADVQARATDIVSGVRIDLGNGDSVILVGVRESQLTAGDFIL